MVAINPSDWLYLAEVKFFEEGSICQSGNAEPESTFRGMQL